MADFLTNLHHVPDLVSLAEKRDNSTWFKALNSDIIPDGDALYLGQRDVSPDETIQAAIKEQINWQDQRNQVLNFLLAVYGENDIQTNVSSNTAQITTKTEFLRHIADISRNRFSAINYPAAENAGSVSGLEKKIRLMTAPDPDMKFYIIENILLLPSDPDAVEGFCNPNGMQNEFPLDFFSSRISIVFSQQNFNDPLEQESFKQAIELNCPAHILPKFHELEPEAMTCFENIRDRWMTAKRTTSYKNKDVDVLSAQLLRFFLPTT